MIKAKCPKCRKLMALEDDQEGKLVMCPHCDAKFRVPKGDGPAPAKSAGKAAKPAAVPADLPIPLKPLEPAPSVDPDFAPYLLKEQEEKQAPPGDAEFIQRMAKDAKIKKARGKAWDLVGPPAKGMKILSLVVVCLDIFAHGYCLVEVTFYNHDLNMRERERQEEIEKARREAQKNTDLFEQIATVFHVNKVYDPEKPPQRITFEEPAKYLWLLDRYRLEEYTPASVALIYIGRLLFRIAVAIVVLAGVEKMKTVESFPWAMTGAIVLIVCTGVYGVIYGILMMNHQDADWLEPLAGSILVGLYGLGGILLGGWAIAVCVNPAVAKEWESRKAGKKAGEEEDEEEETDDNEESDDQEEKDEADEEEPD